MTFGHLVTLETSTKTREVLIVRGIMRQQYYHDEHQLISYAFDVLYQILLLSSLTVNNNYYDDNACTVIVQPNLSTDSCDKNEVH